MFVLKGQLVSLFELPEDFGLAEHHRVQPASDLEQMMQAVRFGQRVEFVIQCCVISMNCDEKSFQLRKRPDGFQRRRSVNFHPVARGKNHRLLRDAGFAQRFERLGNCRFGKRKPFPQFHGR